MSEEVTQMASRGSGTLPRREPDDGRLPRGTSVGRYVVLDHVGTGGMGTVYAAFDPKLDRKLAIKVLALHRKGDPTSVARLAREAQAMARLAHPNVVTIHDVGDHDGKVFLAMEFVEGGTLRQWLRDRDRGWVEIIDAYRSAGRGLVAAHEAGLVHRDFKPDNVMVAPDGRVLVMDFGLARTRAESEEPSTDTFDGDDSVDSILTSAGQLVGTPAYMAPEQFDNAVNVGPASDQFSFCAALYEALFESRPFAGESLPHLVSEVKAGRVRPVPTGSRTPKWLVAAVLKGLAVDPSDRHASMQDLLTTLDRGRGRARGWIYAAGAGVIALTAGGVGLAATSEARTCKAGQKKIDETWNAGRSEAIATAYAGLELPYAAATWSRAAPKLDDFAERWVAGYYDACAATRIDGQQSGQRLDARMDCLVVQQAHFDSLLTEFATPDDALVERTVSAIGGLPKPEDCADIGKLDAEPLPPELRELAIEARSAAAEAKARFGAGRYASARESVERGLALLADNALPGVKAKLLQEHAAALRRLGDLTGAEAALRTGLTAAAEAQDHRLLAGLWLGLVYVVGVRANREKEGIALADVAEVAVLAAGDDPELRWTYEDKRALILRSMQKFDEAVAHHRRALEVAAQLDWDNETFSVLHTNFGNTLLEAGRFEEAKAELERAFAYDLELYGEEHPTSAMDLSDIARACNQLADYECALDLHERALGIRERTLGTTHPDYADSVYNLGLFHYNRMRFEEAEAGTLRAIEIWSGTYGVVSDRVAIGYGQLGNIAMARGEASAAEKHHAKAIEIVQELYGPGHMRSAAYIGNRARALKDLERYEEALELHEEALALREASLGADHPDLAFSLLGGAELLMAIDRGAEGVEAAERAVAIREAKVKRPLHLAIAYFIAARARWAEGTNKERAIELAQKAYRAYSNADTGDPDGKTNVAQWLSERGAPLPVLRD